MAIFEITKSGSSVSLNISDLSRSAVDSAEERVTGLTRVLTEILAADQACTAATGDASLTAARAQMAMEMKYQAALHGLLQQAELCRAIADGTERIEEHGFPEFSDER